MASPVPPGQTMWYYQIGAQQLGPVPFQTLLPMIQNGTIIQATLVWKDGMDQWAAAGTVAEFSPYFTTLKSTSPTPALADANSKKMAAGLLAIFLGQFAVHKFFLGHTKTGIFCIVFGVVTCFFGFALLHVIGIIEGIIYLTKTDEDFYNNYIVNKKTWF